MQVFLFIPAQARVKTNDGFTTNNKTPSAYTGRSYLAPCIQFLFSAMTRLFFAAAFAAVFLALFVSAAQVRRARAENVTS